MDMTTRPTREQIIAVVHSFIGEDGRADAILADAILALFPDSKEVMPHESHAGQGELNAKSREGVIKRGCSSGGPCAYPEMCRSVIAEDLDARLLADFRWLAAMFGKPEDDGWNVKTCRCHNLPTAKGWAEHVAAWLAPPDEPKCPHT